MTTIKMFVVDDVEEMLRKREDSIIQRLSMSAENPTIIFLFPNYRKSRSISR